MGTRWPFCIHLVLVTILLVPTTYATLGAQNVTRTCHEQERLALLKFKQSINDDYNLLSSWVGNDCCGWEKVHCNSVTGDVEGLYLRSEDPIGKYYFIGFGEKYLHGKEVSSSLGELKNLKYMDLSGNNFQGSQIPEFIGSLKQLRYLNLSDARFEGIIPHHIGNLSNLKVLDLSNLEGAMLPDDMTWISSLSSLEHLDLSGMDLSRAQNHRHVVLYLNPSLIYLRLQMCTLSDSNIGPLLNSNATFLNLKHLDLSYNFFVSQLPVFLQNMTSLVFLDLSDTRFQLNFGNLLNMFPSLLELHLSSCGLDNKHLSLSHLNFSILSNIQHLGLGWNSIEGTFPYFLLNMSSLRVLDLSGNWLNSSVPNMSNLLELDLSSNMFNHLEDTGIWRLCRLKQMRLSSAQFDTPIDSSRNLSKCSHYALERLYLDELISLEEKYMIPESLGRLTNLRGLSMSMSFLTGPIPESLWRLRLLEELDLSYNHLTGPIPTFLGKLTKLYLSDNQLNGSIPESLVRSKDLTELYLQNNLLTGPIPALGRLLSLQELSVHSNLLNGTIPVSVGQLSKLQFLDISSNSLEGTVFEGHFVKLSMLKHWHSSSNHKLTFYVSHEYIPPFQLLTLQLSSCKIANGFPQWLRTQRKLKVLLLFNATISGPLPSWLQNMPIIPYLDLSYNNLSGPLANLLNGDPSNLIEVNYDSSLLLENNLFNESIPRSICRWTQLKVLILSRNKLTGELPNCLDNLQNLQTMLLSSNGLSGVIPSSIASSSSSLRWLNLNDNHFKGEIPNTLCDINDLHVLDLGDNELSGNIPQWIGELRFLRVFRLHGNKFTGLIPQSLCENTNLQILDIAHNTLTGPIPHCLGELRAMINGSQTLPLDGGHDNNVIQVMKGVSLDYTNTLSMVFNMDLSSNELTGEIPIELTILSKLVGLNLSNNHLSGSIPNSIGNMKALISLDLSKNKLIGMIPPSMAALTFLSHLNLSHNNLSGHIPTGNQLQTLVDPSIYSGNKGLCGAPLSNNCSNHDQDLTIPKNKFRAADKGKHILFYLDIICGFLIGFWGVIGVLLFMKQWRHKLFMFAEITMDKIYVALMVRIAKIRRGNVAA